MQSNIINRDVEKIRILESHQENLDFIRDMVVSGITNSFFLLNVGEIIRKHEEWKFKMPRVTPFYAVKCNDHKIVLETLVSLGTSFDCASMNEIAKLIDLGVEADRILFAHTIKEESHIEYAASVNVQRMTFDNEGELYKIKKHYPMAKVILRIRCDAKKATVVLGVKFGALLKDAPGLIDLAAQLGLDLVGISFHVGSCCYEPQVFERCIDIGRQMFNLAESKHGIKMNILDLGGGFPGNDEPLFDEMVASINSSLDLHFPEGRGVEIIAEPGRYYVESAFTLVTRINGRRLQSTDDEQKQLALENVEHGQPETSNPDRHYDYYIQEGVFTTFNRLLYGDVVDSPQMLEQRAGPKFPSTVWGPTCCGFDRVTARVELPVMDIDDWLIYKNIGAYSFVCSSHFNGFVVSKVYPVAQQKAWCYLKDRSPFTDAHFVVNEPLVCSPAS